MAKLLQISQLGHPILRDRAKPVDDAHSGRIQDFISDMIATLEEVGGVALAAPQVYQSLRIIIMAPCLNPLYPDTPEMEPTVIINPVIVKESEETSISGRPA